MPESRPRLLIVDDQEQNRYVLARVLERAGYACEQACTGRQALEKAQTFPELIVLDVNLPDMSGYEVCRRLKEDPQTAQIAILQISASFASNDARVRALEGGADTYLTQPIDGVVLVATVRSLLRLRRAETAARESAAQWQSTFNALSEGLAVADGSGELMRCNRAFEQFCSNHCQIHVGMQIAEILKCLLGVSLDLRELGKQRHTSEYSVGDRSLLLSIESVDMGPRGLGKVVVLTDLTDRKLAEYAMRTAEQLAATGRLAHSIAHEINNPLESLVNLIYLAKRAAISKDVHAYLDMAHNELERVGRITKQSLSFHRDTLRPVPVNVGSVIAEVLALYEKVAAAKNVQLVYRERPSLSIGGFPGQLTQVFANLVRNAIEASPVSGRVTIRVRQARRADREGTSVTIHDNGSGIPEAIQPRIFDPFFTTKELKGSGLGLWVSKALVTNHGGEIRFRSGNTRHCGTTFEVFLPITGAQTIAAESAA
jgi:two-component system, NtrC family, sensor kinase